MNGKYEKGEGEIALLLIVWIIAAWLTHIIVCLGEEAWGFLIAGAIFVPIAVIHGTGIWFGAF
jgi:hypothetical protein